MNITTISKKRYMTYEFRHKQPMQMVEMKLNVILDENPHLINSLNRSVNHPLVREDSLFPLEA